MQSLFNKAHALAKKWRKHATTYHCAFVMALRWLKTSALAKAKAIGKNFLKIVQKAVDTSKAMVFKGVVNKTKGQHHETPGPSQECLRK